MRLFAACAGLWIPMTAVAMSQDIVATDGTDEAAYFDTAGEAVFDGGVMTAPAIGAPSFIGPRKIGYYSDTELLLRWFKPVCASVPVVAIDNPHIMSAPLTLAAPYAGQVVIGGSPPHKFEFPMTPGVQQTFGWNGGPGEIGWQASGFVMQEASNSQHFSTDMYGVPYSYLPYLTPQNESASLPFTIPGFVAGSSSAVGSTRLWGAGGDLMLPFTINSGRNGFYGTFMFGGRYLDLTDRVHVNNALWLVSDPSTFATGSSLFSTRNQFAGPQIGTTLGVARGKWSFELTTKFAAGITRQTRNIDGSPLDSSSPENSLLLPGPLLALPSNVGHETANRVTLVPEIGLKSRLAINSWCSLTLGYSLIYWNKVLCPGDQMSPLVNITQLPNRGPVQGPLDPKPRFAHTDYFAQGMNFGAEILF